MQIIEIHTLVDITNTDVRRINQGTQLQLDQFRNWTTLMQTIGLRAIIEYDRDPAVNHLDIKNLNFGTDFKGKHRVWSFQFRPDRADAFASSLNPIELLRQDLNKIPVIINLTETINIRQPVFELNDTQSRNTVVRAL